MTGDEPKKTRPRQAGARWVVYVAVGSTALHQPRRRRANPAAAKPRATSAIDAGSGNSWRPVERCPVILFLRTT